MEKGTSVHAVPGGQAEMGEQVVPHRPSGSQFQFSISHLEVIRDRVAAIFVEIGVGDEDEGFPRFPIKIRACRCGLFRWPIAIVDAAQDKVPVVAVLFAPGPRVPAVAVVAEGSNAMLP